MIIIMHVHRRTVFLVALFSFLIGGIGITQALLITDSLAVHDDSDIDERASAVHYLASLTRRTTRRKNVPKAATRTAAIPQPGTRQMVAVMIENSAAARPHIQGIEKAAMVGEFVVEGGITRLVALFDRNDLPAVIGPVRSLRLYFAQAFLPYSSAVLFAGWSPDAQAFAQKTATPLFVNGLQDAKHFYRDHDIAEPHNYFTDKEKLNDLLASQTLHSVPWPAFPVSDQMLTGSAATTISVNFYAERSNETYVYQPSTQTYVRTNGHDVTASQPSTIVIIETPIVSIGEKGRLTLNLLKGGKMLFFRQGKVIHGKWSKPSVEQGFSFTDEAGNALPMGKGQVWLLALPELGRVGLDLGLDTPRGAISQ